MNDNISKRDYFAGLAMQAYLHSLMSTPSSKVPFDVKVSYTLDIAARSYEMADAMLAARRDDGGDDENSMG